MAEANAELMEWQKRLADKKEELSRLKDGLAQAVNEKQAAQQAVSAGAAAAKAQMMRLRMELTKAKRRLAAHSQALAAQSPEEGAENPPPGAATAKLSGAELDQQNAIKQALLLKERALRQEVERWKHQVTLQEKQRPREESTIVRMKAELTHAADILESTRQAVQHEEVERDLTRQGLVISQEQSLAASQEDSDLKSSKSRASLAGEPVPLYGGGHGGMEARAERHMRQRFEEEGEMLSGKVKQLIGITAAQELLKQRLEKALIKEETDLEQKDRQLAFEVRRANNMQRNLRRRSDEAVAVALGFARVRRGASAAATEAAAAAARSGGFQEQGSRSPEQAMANTIGPGAGPTTSLPYPEPAPPLGASASSPHLPPVEARG